VSIFHDGCTAGPLSDWLNSFVRSCCDAHDDALDHSFDLPTFVHANWDFAVCTWHAMPWFAPVLFIAVSGPVGLVLYWFGPKQKTPDKTSDPTRFSGPAGMGK